MKPLRGEFEAPVRGIYYFSFSSMTSDQVEGTTGVYIYKNGAQFNVIYESHGNKKDNNFKSGILPSILVNLELENFIISRDKIKAIYF